MEIKNMKQWLKKYKNVFIIVFIMIVMAAVKQILVSGFPILPLIGAGEDDGLMVKWAYSILEGKWLGAYVYNTLMKGPVFPIILVTLYKFNMKYLTFTTLFYTVSCLLLVLSIRSLFKNKYWLILIYGILLFNPIMYSSEVFQRVYRNSLIPSFALFIPACYFGMYLNRNKNVIRAILWSILGSISLSLFYYTREDSMWIMPFIIFMSIVIIISLVIKLLREKSHILSSIFKILCVIMPIICLSIFGELLAGRNERYYGLKTKNVLSDSYFTDALNAMYAVKPEKWVDCVTITQEKAKRMSMVSPSFLKIYPYLVETLGGYGTLDRNTTDGECEDGWILWAIRQAATKAGFSDLHLEQLLYKSIADELNYAMDNGYLERQFTLPSPLLSPPRKSYILKTIQSFGEGIIYMSTFKDIYITSDMVIENRIDAYDAVHKFEVITNERAIYYEGTLDGDKEAEQLKDQDEYIESLKIKENILTVITKTYSILGVILLICGIVFYIVLTIKFIKNVKRKVYCYNEKWFVASGILGALFTLLAGVSYNNAATAYSIRVLYLCGTYSLFLAFCIITICFWCDKQVKLLDSKTEKNSFEEEK